MNKFAALDEDVASRYEYDDEEVRTLSGLFRLPNGNLPTCPPDTFCEAGTHAHLSIW